MRTWEGRQERGLRKGIGGETGIIEKKFQDQFEILVQGKFTKYMKTIIRKYLIDEE